MAAAVLTCLCAICLGAQESSTIPEKVRKYRAAHENEIVEEFATLLSIPNLASDMPNIERNAQAVTKALESRGVSVQLLRDPGAPPVVYGRLHTPGARHNRRNIRALRRSACRFTAMAERSIQPGASRQRGGARLTGKSKPATAVNLASLPDLRATTKRRSLPLSAHLMPWVP